MRSITAANNEKTQNKRVEVHWSVRWGGNDTFWYCGEK